MLDKIAAGLLIIVGIINVLPIIVFFDPSKTATLYGVPIEGESLTIMMRHRGVLLFLIGLALIVAAFKPEYRTFAIALALISKFAFLFLTFTGSNYTSELKQVAFIDVGASIALLLVVISIQFFGK